VRPNSCMVAVSSKKPTIQPDDRKGGKREREGTFTLFCRGDRVFWFKLG